MVAKIITAILLTSLSLSAFSTLSTKVNKTTISETEQLQLFIIGNNLSGDINSINLSGLNKNFNIINSSSEIFIGGKIANSKLSLLLKPKRQGSLIIPAFKIGKDQSKPIKIQVKRAKIDKTKQVFITSKVNNKTPYIQQEVIFTVNVYTTEQINGDFHKILNININDAIIRYLNDQGRPRKVDYQGKKLWLKQYKYAIYPQKSGKLFIPKISRNVSLQTRNKIYNIPLFAPAIELKVRPINKNYPVNQHWLPATKVDLSAKFITNPPIFKVGEVVVREIILQVKGQSKNQLPTLPLPNNSAFEQYQDTSNSQQKVGQNNIISTLKQKVIIIPNIEGEQVLPAIQIPWFDTKSNKVKTSTLSPLAIKVIKANIQKSQIKNQKITPKTRQSIIAELPKEIIATTSKPPKSQSLTPNLLAYLFLALWLITLLWCFFSKKITSKTSSPKSQPIDKKPQNSVLKACQTNDPKATKAALNNWLIATQKQHINLDNFAKSTNNQVLITELKKLNQALHQSPQNQSKWQGNNLRQAFSDLIKTQKLTQKPTNKIPELYPNR